MGKIVSLFQLKTAVIAIGEFFLWLRGLMGVGGGDGVRFHDLPSAVSCATTQLWGTFGEMDYSQLCVVFYFRLHRFPVDICTYLSSDLDSPCKNVH